MIGSKVALNRVRLMLAISMGFVACVAQAASGDLDPTFGSGGTAVIDFGADDAGLAMTRDSAETVYVVGYLHTPTRLSVAKTNSAGVLVSSFGTGGKVAPATIPDSSRFPETKISAVWRLRPAYLASSDAREPII